METGRKVHSPSATQLLQWRSTRLGLGTVLLVVAAVGTYLALDGLGEGGSSGSGQAVVTVMMVGASVAIGVFGLRYLLLGLRGGGVVLYELAVEADFFDRLVVPVRRTVPLLRVELGGSDRQTRATAVVSSGHAFGLPAAYVQEADAWYLGSLGSRPVLPGGRSAKERIDAGELRRERDPPFQPLPDHGPPWPTEEVRTGLDESRAARGAAPSPAALIPEGPSEVPEPPLLPDTPAARLAPAKRGVRIAPRGPPTVARPRAPSPPEMPTAILSPPAEGAPMELPDEPPRVPPPITPLGPPPTAVEPPTVTSESEVEPTPPSPGTSSEWELEELPSAEAVPPVGRPASDSDEWELEELPPPEKARGTSKSTSEWEEM